MCIRDRVRLYDHLFDKKNPADVEEGGTFEDNLNPNSLEILTSCKVEPSLAGGQPGSRCQFLRLGYFCLDPDSSDDLLVFNRTTTLRDTWARIERAQKTR